MPELPGRVPRPVFRVDQFAGFGHQHYVAPTMATNFSARVALFDNRASENDRAPVMTGKVEVPVDQLDALYEQLSEQDVQTYGDRRFVTLNLSLWQYDGESSALLFTGKCQTPAEKAPSILPKASEGATTVIRHEQQASSPDAS